MSDLIRKSDVLHLLYGIFNKYRMSTDKNTSIGKSFGTDVFEEIRNMPTAYSANKVVEELEALRNGLNIKCDNLNEALEKGKKIGYNKAIDDFVKEVKNLIVDLSVIRFKDIDEIAEQLKAGGENEI